MTTRGGPTLESIKHDRAAVQRAISDAFDGKGHKAIESGWLAIVELGVDEDLEVRLDMEQALIATCTDAGRAEALLQRAVAWLDDEGDRELRYGAAAIVLTVLGSSKVLSVLRDHEAVLEYLSRAIAMFADAPRSAERSDGRRRAMRVLPNVLSAVMARMARVSGERAVAWFTRECEQASNPQVRQALSDVIVRLQKDSQGVGRAAAERLRKTLEASAAPLRDGVVKRPGTGRGKSSRKIR
jgi:hypothetical protein